MNIRAIGDCIHRNRERIHMSLEELADNTGMSVSALKEYEKGAKKPRASELRRISDVLDVPMVALIHGGTGMYREVRDENGRTILEYWEY